MTFHLFDSSSRPHAGVYLYNSGNIQFRGFSKFVSNTVTSAMTVTNVIGAGHWRTRFDSTNLIFLFMFGVFVHDYPFPRTPKFEANSGLIQVVSTGMQVGSCAYVFFYGRVILEGNQLSCSDGFGFSAGDVVLLPGEKNMFFLLGAGMVIQLSYFVRSTAAFVVSRNILSCGGNAICGGAGMTFSGVSDVAFTGASVFSKNSLLSTSPYYTGGCSSPCMSS